MGGLGFRAARSVYSEPIAHLCAAIPAILEKLRAHSNGLWIIDAKTHAPDCSWSRAGRIRPTLNCLPRAGDWGERGQGGCWCARFADAEPRPQLARVECRNEH